MEPSGGAVCLAGVRGDEIAPLSVASLGWLEEESRVSERWVCSPEGKNEMSERTDHPLSSVFSAMKAVSARSDREH